MYKLYLMEKTEQQHVEITMVQISKNTTQLHII